MFYLLIVVACFWLAFSLAAFVGVLSAKSLEPAADLDLPALRPLVSVVIAARDEQSRIEQTVRGLFEQQGIDLQLIVVDDRSSDATPDILQRLQLEFASLTVLTVEQLPAGWLGKCHACALGAAQATADWILFTDADIHMKPDLLLRAVVKATQQQAQHLTLWPGMNTEDTLTRASVLAFGQVFSVYCPPTMINSDRGKMACGVGAFNLVRAEAYRAIGGHEPLRMEVVDDIKLALLLRRGGFRSRVYSGLTDLEAEWARSIPEAIRIMEKNWFAAAEFNVARCIVAILLVATPWGLAVVGPLLDPLAGTLALAALWSTSLTTLIQTRRAGWPWYVAPWSPLGYPIFLLMGINSAWKTMRQGGIRWRETFYPLADLRAGLVK